MTRKEISALIEKLRRAKRLGRGVQEAEHVLCEAILQADLEKTVALLSNAGPLRRGFWRDFREVRDMAVDMVAGVYRHGEVIEQRARIDRIFREIAHLIRGRRRQP